MTNSRPQRGAPPVVSRYSFGETDSAAVHAVDQLACVHEPVRGLQHQAVAAKGATTSVGLLRRVAVAANQGIRAVSASGVVPVTKAMRSQVVMSVPSRVGAAARRPQ